MKMASCNLSEKLSINHGVMASALAIQLSANGVAMSSSKPANGVTS
jgi:hypothetical protein